ncbi:MAG: peptidase S8, partial [Thermofilum sp.]|nr:peptidase S8 [Thermofilum sp.]
MNAKNPLGILLLALVLAASLLMAFAVPPEGQRTPQVPGEPGISRFVGNLTLGDERSPVSTVVFRKDAPASVVEKAYNDIVAKYTLSRTVELSNGRSVAVKEVRVSKLVRDPSGRYMFRVAEAPDKLSRLLAPYSDYVEQVVSKLLPSLMDKEPLDQKVPRLPAPAPTNVVVADLIGVTRARSVYGVTGSGVNIAIVDTGVDYGHPDLTGSLVYWSGTYKGESIREPLVFDADESQVLLLQDV